MTPNAFGLMIVSFLLVLVVGMFLLALGMTREGRKIKPPARRGQLRKASIRAAVREARGK